MEELKPLIVQVLQTNPALTKKELIAHLSPRESASVGVLESALRQLKESGVIDSRPDPDSKRLRLIWFIKDAQKTKTAQCKSRTSIVKNS